MSLLCPKCHNVMNQYERNGVHVDQCVECRGLFLDRGELDHLIKAEAIYYGEATEAPATAAPPRPDGRPDARYERRPEPRHEPRYEPRYEERYQARPYDEKYYKKKKRRSFFEDLLDLG
jgi:uncharacterized protein